MHMNDSTLATGVKLTSVHFSVEHVRISTTKPYAQVREALESRLGRLDDGIRQMLKRNEIDNVRAALQKAAGEVGLAIHYVGPHGDWLALQGERRKAIAYLIGNVLYAVQMTSVDLAAGLYAPLRVVLYENPEGGSVFEYDRPTTLFGQFGRPEIDRVASILDQRLQTLLMKVSAL
jgi:uncharacterized protein (DUF302 family)